MTNPEVIFWIDPVNLSIAPKTSCFALPTAPLTSSVIDFTLFTKFSSPVLILLTAFPALVAAAVTLSPTPLNADLSPLDGSAPPWPSNFLASLTDTILGDFCDSAFCSFDSFFTMIEPSFLILPV